jgi:hypothetical protein
VIQGDNHTAESPQHNKTWYTDREIAKKRPPERNVKAVIYHPYNNIRMDNNTCIAQQANSAMRGGFVNIFAVLHGKFLYTKVDFQIGETYGK